MIHMPSTIPSLNTTGFWADDYFTVIPSLLGYFGGNTPTGPDGWLPDELVLGPSPHPDGANASFGIGTKSFLHRMIGDGFTVSADAFRHADGIGGTNLSNVVLNPSRTRVSLGTHASYYETHSFNSLEIHGVGRTTGMTVALNMKPSQFTGSIQPGWFSVTGDDGQTMDFAAGLTSLPEHTLWSEGSAGNPGQGHSVPFGLPNLHSDGEYKSDPTMKMWIENILQDNDPNSLFSFGNFSARPKPGYWSFWFYCPRTERVSPVWYNRAGCPAGGQTAVDANIHDPDWYPDNWALNGGSMVGLITGNFSVQSQAWDVVGGDRVLVNGAIVSPMFSGINAYTAGRYCSARIRPLCEYKFRDYYVLTQSYEVMMFDHVQSATKGTAVGAEVLTSRSPSSQVAEGIGFSHPSTKVPESDVIAEPALSYTTFTTDSVVGSDPTHGRLAYAAQYDGLDGTLIINVGSNQTLRFDTSGAAGESYRQSPESTLTRTSGCLDVDFLQSSPVVQSWISPITRALELRNVNGSFVSAYTVGGATGFKTTDAQVNGSTNGAIAHTTFFLPPVDPLMFSYAQTYAVSNGVTNEYRLPVIRIRQI
jgi:hypothetical protein